MLNSECPLTLLRGLAKSQYQRQAVWGLFQPFVQTVCTSKQRPDVLRLLARFSRWLERIWVGWVISSELELTFVWDLLYCIITWTWSILEELLSGLLEFNQYCGAQKVTPSTWIPSESSKLLWPYFLGSLLHRKIYYHASRVNKIQIYIGQINTKFSSTTK